MRMTDEEYFRSCIAKERQLAHLLGHHNIEELYESAGTLWAGNKALPKWTRDWKACGQLLAQYELPVAFIKEAGQEHSTSVQIGNIKICLTDHPNAERAIMFGIVKAVISSLEHHKNHKTAQA
ncbi:hypothetical protein EDC30_103192 [Paucimonas lemoignei]|uniref:Aminoacyl-tRNA synthetase n=1 Tax=Paucimonas lemoignei TaxID=29443 RepID=A0A4V2UIY5_PAULE|nr:aminoacyl-tRNA synthetase [Paucimonas lemoignei]TCS37900.1 hypothetical protein EDC30_103192 [Paucimonas lemoignei]